MGNEAKPISFTKCGLCAKGAEESSLCGLAATGISEHTETKNQYTYKIGDTIYYEDDPCKGVYCLKSGLVAIRKSDINGDSAVMRLVLPGEAFGHRAYLANENHAGSAEVLLDSRLCFIPKQALDSIFIKSPDTALRFTRRVAKDLREIEELFLITTTKPVRQRLIHFLLGFHNRYQKDNPQENGSTFELPLSRQELAAAIGTRPETIARTIKKLETDGVCHFKGRMVSIFAPDRLLEDLNSTE